MTTIAIVGGGIAARSLLYAMAKKKISHKILVFYSDTFAFPCSLHSTAIVAPRGVSTGHSPLGDNLVEGFERFQRHVREDRPEGVIVVPQYTGALTKLESFQKRYPKGLKSLRAGDLRLKEEFFLYQEEAFLIRPREYMDWLLRESGVLDLTLVDSFVTEVEGQMLRTVNGEEFTADEIIFTAGVQNSLWSSFFNEPKKTKSAQGCYLEFFSVALGTESFSLTLEGDNIIYDGQRRSLLMGSTTQETYLDLPPEKELRAIYDRLSARVELVLPGFETATMRTGLREKGHRREAYLLKHGPYAVIGGLYKNGYRLALTMAEKYLLP